MNIIQAIIYGIVQGIAEFLPISSTAHITLLPWLFKWQDPGVAFDVALHLGTATAVIIFFLKDWLRLIQAAFKRPKSPDGKLFWLIVLATIPGAIAGVLLDKYMVAFREPLLIGITLIVMGIILYFADKLGQSNIELKDMEPKQSVLIGLSQIFAIIPGVSRSGVTMSMGRALGVTRDSCARFTFLMSAPIILADGLYHAKDMANIPIDTAAFIVAILTSAIISLLSIRFLLGYLRKKGFAIFAIYRILFGLFIIGLSVWRR